MKLSMLDKNNFEVLIIGGSYAGLSAALALGRSMRNVLIIDSGVACNQQTPYSHNFITQDGEKPGVIAEKAKLEVLKYSTVKFHKDKAISVRKTDNGFTITTQAGREFRALKLIFATGITDIFPDIQGFSECWGISIVHCPYCHGYEFRNQKTAIMGNGEVALHLSSLVHNLSQDITILSSGKPEFSHGEITKLERNNIRINEKQILEFEHINGKITNVIFQDGSKINFAAVYTSIPFKQHSDIPFALGCEITEHGYIKIDDFQKTTVAGVFACGDNSGMRSIAKAVYSGNVAGAITNKELADEQFQ
jgi:thioredoxin reductase